MDVTWNVNCFHGPVHAPDDSPVAWLCLTGSERNSLLVVRSFHIVSECALGLHAGLGSGRGGKRRGRRLFGLISNLLPFGSELCFENDTTRSRHLNLQ